MNINEKSDSNVWLFLMPFYAIIFRLPYGNEYLSFTFTA